MANLKHGKYGTPVYKAWQRMIERCLRPKFIGYEHYGGRGITVCADWRTFTNFYASMGEPPEGTTLDRINVNGNYEPGNCRWATPRVQQNNKRTSRYLTFNGKTATISDWALSTGLNYTTIKERIRHGWSVDQALTEPAASSNYLKRQDLRATSEYRSKDDPKISTNPRALAKAGICCRGHPLTDDNTYWAKNRLGNMKRRCRLCALREAFRRRHPSLTS